MPLSPLPAEFYQRPVQAVARDLLGARLVRVQDGLRLAGTIIETEAYDGESDLACHARAGRTPRTEVMYGPAGRAYIYFIYGMHWMLNCVTGEQGHPAAVLIRALQVIEGEDEVVRRRAGARRVDWTSGPARICQAFQIDGQFNGCNLTSQNSPLWIEPAPADSPPVLAGPRVGIQNVPEPWRSMPWRFRIEPLRAPL